MSDQPKRSPIVAFYLDGGKDPKGRTFADMLSYRDTELERSHDCVQWLFPLNEPSAHLKDAPVLTADDVASLATPQGQVQYLLAVERFLKFFSLKKVKDAAGTRIEPAGNFDTEALLWLNDWRGPNHNLKRVTRIIRCAMLLGRRDVAEVLRDGFVAAATKTTVGRQFVTPTTLQFWVDAVDLPFTQVLNPLAQTRFPK